MGRRSDHSRAELEELILAEGAKLLAAEGLARFSAREVAKRIGYTIGTVHNVVGNFDRLVTVINNRTFVLWADDLRLRLEKAGSDRIAALVEGYFAFARENTKLWAAIYDHRLPQGLELSADDHAARAGLTRIVIEEVALTLNRPVDGDVETLARSLVATVHGHCSLALTGAWALMTETSPEMPALARVREALEGQRRDDTGMISVDGATAKSS